MIKFSKEFVVKAKNAYPNNKDLALALDEGLNTVGNILCEERDKLDDVFQDWMVEVRNHLSKNS